MAIKTWGSQWPWFKKLSKNIAALDSFSFLCPYHQHIQQSIEGKHAALDPADLALGEVLGPTWPSEPIFQCFSVLICDTYITTIIILIRFLLRRVIVRIARYIHIYFIYVYINYIYIICNTNLLYTLSIVKYMQLCVYVSIFKIHTHIYIP